MVLTNLFYLILSILSPCRVHNYVKKGLSPVLYNSNTHYYFFILVIALPHIIYKHQFAKSILSPA